MRIAISNFIDKLPPIPRKLLRMKAVRYLFAAGTATIVDIALFAFVFNVVLNKQDVLIGFLNLGAPGISLAVSYSVGLVVNFTITKYFVFTQSDLKTKHQFFRFSIVALAVLFANYGFMKILIELFKYMEIGNMLPQVFMGHTPIMARAVSALCIGVLSFMIHKVFSFNVKTEK